MKESNLLTTKEAAAFLRTTPMTLYRWRSKKSGYLPYVKIGAKVFYRLKDLEDFINSNVVSLFDSNK